MTKIWKKKSQEEIKDIVFNAIEKNVSFDKNLILGVPASSLDDKVFNQDVAFLKEAPFMFALSNNPNHIGCHTLGNSEPFFEGTIAIEKELIEMCAVDILKGEENQQDGYIASGGTEANIQAIWIYRNFFMKEYEAKHEDIAILCSSDTHYSVYKAANILSLDVCVFEVEENTREINKESLNNTISSAKQKGKKYFVSICNMMTTMFGSVDDIDLLVAALNQSECPYKIHVDGAYGGFYYPFSSPDSTLTFKNPSISSFTLDAHKMAQSPYGTGVFLIRKGLINYVNTQEASYVKGEDYTLIGSRSGANAIATWMILVKNGPYGWHEKVFILQKRTNWLCDQLNQLNIDFYRNEHSNIVTIRAKFVSKEIAEKFSLVPDNHSKPKWYKIVVMDHVMIEQLSALIEDLKSQ